MLTTRWRRPGWARTVATCARPGSRRARPRRPEARSSGQHGVGRDLPGEQAAQLGIVFGRGGSAARGQLARPGAAARDRLADRLDAGLGQLARWPTQTHRRPVALAMKGTSTTRTVLSPAGRSRSPASRLSPPAMAQDRLVQTRTVVAGSSASSSTTSEVVVEGRDLVHLGLAQAQPLGQRGQQALAQAAFGVPGCGAGARSAGRPLGSQIGTERPSRPRAAGSTWRPLGAARKRRCSRPAPRRRGRWTDRSAKALSLHCDMVWEPAV